MTSTPTPAPTPPAPEEGAKERPYHAMPLNCDTQPPTEISKEAREVTLEDKNITSLVRASEADLGSEFIANYRARAIDTVAAPLRREVEVQKQRADLEENAARIYAGSLARSRERCAELEKEVMALNMEAASLEDKRDALQARTEQLTAEVLTLREAAAELHAADLAWTEDQESTHANRVYKAIEALGVALARTADYASLVPVKREELEGLRKDRELLDGVERLKVMIWCEHSMNAKTNTTEYIWSARHSGPKKTAREAIGAALAASKEEKA